MLSLASGLKIFLYTPAADMRKGFNGLGGIRNHFVELQRYLDDPWLPIDNNLTEQLMNRSPQGGCKDRCAPDVPRRASGRSEPRDDLLAMFVRTVAVWSAICI